MRKLIQFAAAFVIMILTACGTVQKEEIVQLPATTPFDANPNARNVYLDAYEQGYRTAFTNPSVPSDYFRGPFVSLVKLGGGQAMRRHITTGQGPRDFNGGLGTLLTSPSINSGANVVLKGAVLCCN